MEKRAFEILGVGRDVDWATIRTAYRVLARRYHPDGSTPDQSRMADINRAYEWIEIARRRTADGAPSPTVGAPSPASGRSAGLHARMTSHERLDAPDPGVAGPSDGSLLGRVQAAQYRVTPVIDFGEYAGWRIADVARVDPRYLRWLSRHSSGIRYRAAIAEVLDETDVGRSGDLLL